MGRLNMGFRLYISSNRNKMDIAQNPLDLVENQRKTIEEMVFEVL